MGVYPSPEPSYEYVDMECEWDTSYVNDFDGTHNNVKSNWFLSGQNSYHSNSKEDRRFKWRYCRPKGDSDPFNGASRKLETTPYDELWVRTCYVSPAEAMVGGYSTHSNSKEDRQWTMSCAKFKDQYQLVDCAWPGRDDHFYVNSYDGVVDYECPNDGVISAISTKHDNGKEDRLWSFDCCRLAYDETSESQFFDSPDVLSQDYATFLWMCIGVLIVFIYYKLKQKFVPIDKYSNYQIDDDDKPITTYHSI